MLENIIDLISANFGNNNENAIKTGESWIVASTFYIRVFCDKQFYEVYQNWQI